MKKVTSLFIAVVTVAIAAMVVFYSCGKQDMENSLISENQEVLMSTDDQIFLENLVNFRNKVNFIRSNPELKSGEVMAVDEAINQVEALFNATYGFPDEQYGKTKTDSSVIQIAVNDYGMVVLDDVVAKFDEIINLVTQYYYGSGFENKGFLLLDLEKGEIINGQLVINLRSVTGEMDNNWEPFGPDDDWLYGYNLGRCDYSQDTTDAAEEIQKAVNRNKPLISPPYGYRFVYVLDDLITLDYDVLTNYPAPENPPPANYMDYLIFYVTEAAGQFTQGVEDCLIPDEMNFHFEGEKTVIYQNLPVELNKPQNWTFMECNLIGRSIRDVNNNLIYYHKNYLTYAYRYLVPVSIIEPPIDL